MSEPSELKHDECFAVLEYCADLIVQEGNDVLPEVQKYLAGCPDYMLEYRDVLLQLANQDKKLPRFSAIEPAGSGKN